MYLTKLFIPSWLRIPLLLAMAVALALALPAGPPSATAQTTDGPSAFCHVTDSDFTDCDAGTPGIEEWSDITPTFFPETDSYLYADQADLDPTLAGPDSPMDTFMLMYDECGLTEPLGPDEYFLVYFNTIEEEDGVPVFENYVIHLFTDGTIIFLENGVAEEDELGEIRVEEIAGQRGDVGFGPSANCAFDHVIAEFEIKLSITGFDVDGGLSTGFNLWLSRPPPTPPPGPEILQASVKPQEVELGDPYDLSVLVRENAGSAQAVTVVVDETARDPRTLQPAFGDTLAPRRSQIKILSPGSPTSYEFPSYTHYWNWIGPGFTGGCFNPLEFIRGVDQTLLLAALEDFLEKLSTRLSVFLNAVQVIRAFEDSGQTVKSNEYEYQIVARDEDLRQDVQRASVVVAVPAYKRIALGTFITLSLGSSYSTGLGIAALVPPATPGGLGLLAAEAAQLAVACVAYKIADDPDPNFTEIPSRQAITLAALDTIADSPGKQLAEAWVEVLADERALLSALARYEGAKAAGERQWMLAQLEAAEQFQAALLNDLSLVGDATEALINHLESENFTLTEADLQAASDQLLNEGLPQIERDILTELDFTAEEIDRAAVTAAAVIDLASSDWQNILSNVVGEVTASTSQMGDWLEERKLTVCPDDFDSDGLTVEQELQLGTNPCTPDSDGDGFEDEAEVAIGSDPLDAASTPEGADFGETCMDSIDNDLDTLIDADDAGCAEEGRIGMIADTNGSVTIFDSGTDSVLGTVGGIGSSTVGDCSITADGTLGFVTDFRGTLTVIDLTVLPPTRASGQNPIPMSNLGEDSSITPDQKFVVVVDGGASQPISVIDIASRAEISTFSLGIHHNSVEVLDDGSVLVTGEFDGVHRLTIDQQGNLAGTGETHGTGGDPNNVFGAPGGTSGIVVMRGPQMRSFSIPGLTLVDARTLSGNLGISGAIAPGGSRVFVRSNASGSTGVEPGGGGFVDVFSYSPATGSLGAAPLFSIPLARSAPTFFGMDQMAITPGGTKLYVAQPDAVNVYNAFTGALLTTITDSNFTRATGICFSAAGPSPEPPPLPDIDNDGVSDALDNCPSIPNPDQADGNFNGIGDVCENAGDLFATSAFLNATIDGSTVSEELSLVIGDEPEFDDRLARIVDYHVTNGLVESASEFTQDIVNSLVDIGQVPPEEAGQLVDDVLLLVDQDSDGVPDGQDACPTTPGLPDRQGCPVGDENVVDLHVVDQAKTGVCPDGKGSCKSPIEGAEVRVFDRNDSDFQAEYGTKNPSGSVYDQVFENDIGRVGACTTDAAGECTAGEESTGDYLVIVKYLDAETVKTVYTGKPKSPGDFVDTDADTQGDLATKDFQVIKVLRKNGSIQFSGGSKTVVTGSYLEVISPDFAIWEDVAAGYVYTFIFISDSDWDVDLCTRVPHGYAIVGVYDENGDLMSDSRCTQTFVSGEAKVIAYEVQDVGSPEPRVNARLTVKHRGRATTLTLDVPGIRIAEEHAPRGPLAFGVAGASLVPVVAMGLAYVAVSRRRRRD